MGETNSVGLPSKTFLVDVNQKENYPPFARCVLRGKETADDEAQVSFTEFGGEPAFAVRLKSEVDSENGLFGLNNGKDPSDRVIVYTLASNKIFATDASIWTDGLNGRAISGPAVQYEIKPTPRIALIMSQALQCYGYEFAYEGKYKEFEFISATAKFLDVYRDSTNPEFAKSAWDVSVPGSRAWDIDPVPVTSAVAVGGTPPSLSVPMLYRADLEQKHGFYPTIEGVGRGPDTADNEVYADMRMIDGEKAAVFRFKSEVFGKVGLYGIEGGKFSDYAIVVKLKKKEVFAAKLLQPDTAESTLALRGAVANQPPKRLKLNLSTKFLLKPQSRVTLLVAQAFQSWANRFANAGMYKEFKQLTALSKLLDENRNMLIPVGSPSFEKCAWWDWPCNLGRAIDAGAIIY